MARLSRLSRQMRWAYLVPVAAVLSVHYRWQGRTRTFSQVVERLRSSSRPQPGGGALHRTTETPPPEMIQRAVDMATSVWPFRTTCLIQSLTTGALLRRFGYPASIAIGVPAKDAGRPEGKFAHAWVDVGSPQPEPRFGEIVRVEI